MTNLNQNQYKPDAVTPPGDTLLELLEMRRMSQSELAERTGRPKKTINEIVKGKAAITAETAIQFERVLGVAASFWISREHNYREAQARAKETETLKGEVGWLQELPYRAMVNLGWINDHQDKTKKIEELLHFFAVASPSSWKEMWQNPAAAFHQSTAFTTSRGAVAAWLRRGELEANQQDCAAFDTTAFKAVLAQIRPLTRTMPDDLPKLLRHYCNGVGVALAFVPEMPGTRLWGAARWLNPTCALIQLSLRYKTDDHFWFTFFHEAGHLLLHSRREVFLDEDGLDDSAQKEMEANVFARDWLIPEFPYKQFCRKGSFSCAATERFAFEIGVSPGVIVGRLQHDGRLDKRLCNELKKDVSWILDSR